MCLSSKHVKVTYIELPISNKLHTGSRSPTINGMCSDLVPRQNLGVSWNSLLPQCHFYYNNKMQTLRNSVEDE